MTTVPYCHCAGTTKVAMQVMGRNAWRGQPWGDLGKQTCRGCGRDMLGQTV